MLPAYGKELLNLRRSGKRPADPVYVAERWRVAKLLQARDRMVLVAENAGEVVFDWRMCSSLEVIVLYGSLGWVEHVLPRIRAARPRSMRAFDYCELDWRTDEALQAFVLRAMAAGESTQPGLARAA